MRLKATHIKFEGEDGMSEKYTLVVIDMQDEFGTARQRWLVNNTCYYIRKAIRDDCPILLVRYQGEGMVVSAVRSAVDGYSQCYRVTKGDDDGAVEIRRVIYRKKLPKTLRVCGVNTSCCVRDTVTSLKRGRSYDITILESACNCWSKAAHMAGLKSMRTTGATIQKSRMRRTRKFGQAA